MMLVSIWEVWNWSTDAFIFLGVLLLLYSANAHGFATGRYPERFKDRDPREAYLANWDGLPGWVQFAIPTAIAGAALILWSI